MSGGVGLAAGAAAAHGGAHASTKADAAAHSAVSNSPGKGGQGGAHGSGNAGSGSAPASSGPPPGHGNSNGGGGGHGNHGNSGHGNSGHGNSGHGNSGHRGHGSSKHGGAATGSGGASNGQHGQGHGAASGASNGHHGRGHGAGSGASNGHQGRGHGAGGGASNGHHGRGQGAASGAIAAPAAVTPAPALAAAAVPTLQLPAAAERGTSTVAKPRSRRPALDSSATTGLLAGAGAGAGTATGGGTGGGTGSGTGGAAISGLLAGTTAGQLISPFTTGSRTTTEPFTATPAGGSAGSTAAVAPRRSRLPDSTSSQPSEFQRIVRVVPEVVWLALAGALLLALLSGASAVWSGARVRRQAGRFAEMSVAALTDPLTGILNRRGFTEAANRELERARRYGRPLALAYVDVRGLKTVNDSEGHGAGDDLLRATARLLTDSARENDVVGRLGGDEMGLLLVEQTPEGAQAATQRIEAEVLERRPVIGLQSPWDLTVGTSTFPGDGETVEELLRAADTRLYEQRGIELR
ncbi:MAG TPA: GGDEF domain-containing protein [Solirubrobacteraceae bacterium]